MLKADSIFSTKILNIGRIRFNVLQLNLCLIMISSWDVNCMHICSLDYIPGDKNISILHLSSRMSDLQFSFVLLIHVLVL